jgi:hypothetical protein
MRGTAVFILGSPRSGTTYLNTILNRHPKVFIANELRFMSFYHHLCTDALDALPEHPAREAFIEHFRGEIGRQVESFFFARMTKLGLKTGQSALSLLSRIDGSSVWGDKDPFIGRRKFPGLAGLTEACFPEARFMHIIRDPRNAISSRMVRGRTMQVTRAIRDWRDVLEAGRVVGQRVGPGRYRELQYETLCSDAAELLVADLLSFLGLKMHARVRRFLRRQAAGRRPAGRPASGVGDIGDASVYKKRLAPEQIETINESLGDLIEELGYE